MPRVPTFNLFIASENNAAFFEARKVEDQVEALCGQEIQVSRVFWSYSLLRDVLLRERAAAELAAAQMLILSITKSSELPTCVKALLERLPMQKYAGDAAFVALIGGRTENHLDWSPLVSHLRDVAISRRWDFFCNRPLFKESVSRRAAFETSSYGARTRAGVISYHFPCLEGSFNA